MPARRHRLFGALLSMAVAAAAGLTGCSTDEAPDTDTAELTVDGSASEVSLTACGLDGRTVFLVGRSSDGLVLQAVIGLDEDDEADLAATAVTVDRDGAISAAAGADAAPGLQLTGPAPGEIRSASLEGDRVRMTADLERVTNGRRSTGDVAGELRLDARCPDESS